MNRDAYKHDIIKFVFKNKKAEFIFYKLVTNELLLGTWSIFI